MTKRFATDAEMAYAESRTRIAPGEAFQMDQLYRLAQLPLVAPAHPDVITEGTGYRMGIHAPVHSLVLMIDGAALEATGEYQALIAALRAAPFSGKIAWDVLARRKDRLHATLCGNFDAPDGFLPEAARGLLAAIPAFDYQLRGLFSGDRNHGRLYLALYPEIRDGGLASSAVMEAFGREPARLLLVGLVNLVDHLDRGETEALAELLENFRDNRFLTARASEIVMICSFDDLVLDAAITDRIALSSRDIPRA